MRHLSDGISTLILATMAKSDQMTDNFGDTSHRAEGLPVYVAQIDVAQGARVVRFASQVSDRTALRSRPAWFRFPHEIRHSLDFHGQHPFANAVNALPPDPKEISALLRLLDDDTPEVRSVVAGRLAEVGGDLSEILPGMAHGLSGREKELLKSMLLPARRRTLREEWITPGFGSAGLGDDWELFESHLRLISDFLHDGLSLRQPLSDALDLLAEEAQEDGVSGPNDLRVFLFERKKLGPNGENYYDPRNSDLAWCLSEGVSNPIGLGVIYMLTGQRLGLEIEGISFPGHFLCRFREDGYPLIVDCYDKGCIHSQNVLTDPSNDLSREQRRALEGSADLGTILLRILNNLTDAFVREGREEDVGLIREMRDSMAP